MRKYISIFLILISILTGCKHTDDDISVSEVTAVSDKLSGSVSQTVSTGESQPASQVTTSSESSSVSHSGSTDDVLLYLVTPAQGSLVVSTGPVFKWTCNADVESFTLIIEE
ncbi:MAG: hypothetical protein WC212_03130, partial [Candidatus Delongbacteria bacterium]